MTKLVGPHTSPRHGFFFSHVPTRRVRKFLQGPGCIGGRGAVVHEPADYGAIVDSVYEMADAIANGNGVTPEEAVDQVLRDERWTLLQGQRNDILNRLKA